MGGEYIYLLTLLQTDLTNN